VSRAGAKKYMFGTFSCLRAGGGCNLPMEEPHMIENLRRPESGSQSPAKSVMPSVAIVLNGLCGRFFGGDEETLTPVGTWFGSPNEGHPMSSFQKLSPG